MKFRQDSNGKSTVGFNEVWWYHYHSFVERTYSIYVIAGTLSIFFFLLNAHAQLNVCPRAAQRIHELPFSYKCATLDQVFSLYKVKNPVLVWMEFASVGVGKKKLNAGLGYLYVFRDELASRRRQQQTCLFSLQRQSGIFKRRVRVCTGASSR